MKPLYFNEQNVVYAKNQPEYLPLPSHLDKDGIVTSCWGLSWKERIKALFTGVIYFQQMTFNKPLQPQKPSVENPLKALK